MTKHLKLSAIGNSTGIVIPKDVLSRLRLEQGDTLSLIEVPGGIELRASNPDFDAQMAVAREVMKRRKRALAELAK